MLNREAVRNEHEKQKRLAERKKQLLSCQQRLYELSKEMMLLKSEHENDNAVDINSIDFNDDNALDEYIKSLVVENDDDNGDGSEEKKCDTGDITQYLEGYGVTSDMIDESSLRYLIKEQEEGQDSSNKINSSNSNDVDNRIGDGSKVEIWNNDDALFQETKESLILFQVTKEKQVLDLVDKANNPNNTNSDSNDPYETITSLQEINIESKNIQKKLWALCEKQQEAIVQTREKLGKLENDLIRHQSLIIKFQKKYSELLDRDHRATVDAILMDKNLKQQQQLHDNATANVTPENNNNGVVVIGTGRLARRIKRVIAIFTFLFTAFTNTKFYRVLKAAYADVKSQNINIQIDLTSLMKLIVFLLVFGARTANKKQDISFYSKYRHHFLSCIFIMTFLLQSGIAIFVYRFFARNWIKLWKDFDIDNNATPGDSNNASTDDNDNNDPNERRQQRQRNPNITPASNNNNTTQPEAQPPTLINGGVYHARRDDANRQSILHDIKYFFTSLFLSLSPTWRPIGIDTPQEQQPMQQPQPANADNDNNNPPLQDENNE